MRTGPICISEPTKTTRCKYTQPRKERGKGSGLMTLPWGSQPPVGGSALISLTDTPPHPRKIHIKVREKKRERKKKKKNGAGGGVLQGKGPFPSSVWDPWWNWAAQGAGLLKNRSKVKSLQGQGVQALCPSAALACAYYPIDHRSQITGDVSMMP